MASHGHACRLTWDTVGSVHALDHSLAASSLLMEVRAAVPLG